MDRIIKSTVPAEFSGLRLDLYLAARFNYLSRSAWRKRISDSLISVNGNFCANQHKKLREGDTVEYEYNPSEEPAVDRNYSILFEDRHILAVSKSGNLPVHPSGAYFNNTLKNILEQDFVIKLHPVHRIDRETSGLILFAKDRNSASVLQSNFHHVKKTYIAISHGSPQNNSFTIDMPLGPDEHSVIKKKRKAFPEAGEKAVTGFIKLAESGGFCLLKAMPATGRLHQIRAHLLYAGLPILGDKLYGLDENCFLEFVKNGPGEELHRKLGFCRCALHSRSLIFRHPADSKTIKIKAELPNDMKNFLREREVLYV